MVHMVIYHSAQASVRETSHDREYKCTIKVRRKKALGKASLSCLPFQPLQGSGMYVGNMGEHTHTHKKNI